MFLRQVIKVGCGKPERLNISESTPTPSARQVIAGLFLFLFLAAVLLKVPNRKIN